MTVKTPEAPPLPADVETLLRRLRMPYIRQAAPDVLATATSQRWEPAEVLRVLLAEEAAGRDQATIRMRRRSSGLPAGKTLTPGTRRHRRSRRPASRRCGRWSGSTAPENRCACGPSGTGKVTCSWRSGT